MVRHRRKTVEELLGDLIWQGAVQVYFLKVIAEGITNMPSDVVTQLNTKFDEIEQTLRDEAEEIRQAIADAQSGGATPEELAALNARADGINAAVEALVVAPAPPADPNA